MPSYWIAHPTELAFISALSPEGVAGLLGISRRWPAKRYIIREHRHEVSPTPGSDPVWGYAIKDVGGDVLLEPSDDPL